MRRLWRIYRPIQIALIIAGLFVISPTLECSSAEEITLTWDSNTEPDLAGYIIYQSINAAGPPYEYIGTIPEDELADPLNPTAVISDLQDNTRYFFVVTAYDASGNESALSNEVQFEIGDPPPLDPPPADDSGDGGSDGGGGGGGGGGCFIASLAGEINAAAFLWGGFLLIFMLVTSRNS